MAPCLISTRRAPLTRRRIRWHVAVTIASAIATVAPVSAQATQSLSLAQAIDEALAHSPVLAPTRDALRLAEIQEQLARSAFGVKITPTLSATSDPFLGDVRSAGITVSKRLSLGGQVFVQAASQHSSHPAWGGRQASYTLGVSQPLLQGFSRAISYDREIAKHGVSSRQRELTSTRAALVVRVIAQYALVLKHQRAVEVTQQTMIRGRGLRLAAEARARAGLGTELDVVRAHTLEAQMSTTLSDVTDALGAASDELLAMLGRNLAATDLATFSLAPPDWSALESLLASLPASVNDLVTTALAERVEVAAARAQARDARRAAEIADWQRLPPLSLDVRYTQRAHESAAGSARSALPDGWQVALTSSHTFDRSSGTAAADRASVSVDAAERAVRDVEQQIAAEVRRAHRAWQSATAQISLQRNALSLAERERQIAAIRAERGLATSLEIIDAHLTNLRAEQVVIAADLDRIVKAIELVRAIGRTGLERLVR